MLLRALRRSNPATPCRADLLIRQKINRHAKWRPYKTIQSNMLLRHPATWMYASDGHCYLAGTQINFNYKCNVHFFFLIATQKEKVNRKRKTRVWNERVIRNYVPEPSFKKRGNAENPALPDSINELIPLSWICSTLAEYRLLCLRTSWLNLLAIRICSLRSRHPYANPLFPHSLIPF